MSKGNQGPPLPQLELRPLYRLGELAKLVHLSKHQLKQLLDERGMKWLRIGRWDYLLLSELEEKLPLVWKSICASSLAGRGRERAGRQEERVVTTGPQRTPQGSR